MQDEAERIIADLREDGSDFGSSSVRLFYRDVVLEFERLDRPGADAVRLAEVARRLVRVGQDLLDQIEGDGSADTEEQRTLLVSVRNRIGSAAQRLWELEEDRSALAIAFAQYGSVLELDARNTDALRGVAVLGGPLGENQASLDAWRTLLSGYRPGSESWFEARTEHLKVLSRVDRERAKAVLRQHSVLYPDLGPEPQAIELRELAEQLGVELSSEGARGG